MGYKKKGKVKTTPSLGLPITLHVVKKPGGEDTVSARKEFGVDILNLRNSVWKC